MVGDTDSRRALGRVRAGLRVRPGVRRHRPRRPAATGSSCSREPTRASPTPAAVATAATLNGLDPEGDEDADSLSNAFEVEHGLDPRLADTDQDGLSDAAELALGTNPLAVDTDLDGFTDRAELEFGTDPLGTEPPAPALSELDPPDGDDGLA